MEIVVTEIIVTVRELQAGTIPKPSQYIASLAVFGVLGGVAAINPQTAKLAATFGAVVLLTSLLTDPKTVPEMFTKIAGMGKKTVTRYGPS